MRVISLNTPTARLPHFSHSWVCLLLTALTLLTALSCGGERTPAPVPSPTSAPPPTVTVAAPAPTPTLVVTPTATPSPVLPSPTPAPSRVQATPTSLPAPPPAEPTPTSSPTAPPPTSRPAPAPPDVIGLEPPGRIPAPAPVGLDGWINSEPLEVTDFADKIVLFDFWTYTCVNCIRTLPYLQDWHEKYADEGLLL